MRLSLSLFALSLAVLGSPLQGQENGTVTVFRERATSRLKMFSMQDQWPVRLHKRLELDGMLLLDMHGEQFASCSLPAGRHSIKFEKYGGATADFELHPGERVFVRPGFMGGQFFEAARFTLTVVSCAQAIELGRGDLPMPKKYSVGPQALQEDEFPTTCAGL